MEVDPGPPMKRLKMEQVEAPITPDPSSPANSCEDEFLGNSQVKLERKENDSFEGGKKAEEDNFVVVGPNTPATVPPSPTMEFQVVINTPPTQEKFSSPDSSNSKTSTTDESNEGIDSGVIKVSSEPSAATAPPAKKRKPPKPKERTTERVNLAKLDYNQKLRKKQLASLVKIFSTKKKIVVIAGAGISVAAGIPDFRSSTGLFTSLRNDYKLKGSGKQLFDAAVYKDDQSTSSFHDMVRQLHNLSKDAPPTVFHELLQSLAKEKRLLRLYTQNVDCIDTQLEGLETQEKLPEKGPWPTTIQLHGGINHMVCQKCGDVKPLVPELFQGSTPPDCRECLGFEEARKAGGRRSLGIGKLRPRMVLYNEHNPDSEAIGCVTEADLKARPDALIVVGTSLKIPGVKRMVREMCGVVRSFRGGMTCWLNPDDPPLGREFDGVFDLVVKGDCQHAARLIKQGDTPLTPLSMSDTDSELSVLSMASDDEMEETIRTSLLPKPPSVVIPRMPLSPSASPRPNALDKKAASLKKGAKRFSDGTVKNDTKNKPKAASKLPVTVRKTTTGTATTTTTTATTAVAAKKKSAPATKKAASSPKKATSGARKMVQSSITKVASTKAKVTKPVAASTKAKATKITKVTKVTKAKVVSKVVSATAASSSSTASGATKAHTAKSAATKARPIKLKLSKPKVEQKSKITGQFKPAKTSALAPHKGEKQQQQQEKQQISLSGKDTVQFKDVIHIIKDASSTTTTGIENKPQALSIPPPPSRELTPPPPPPPLESSTSPTQSPISPSLPSPNLHKMALSNLLL